jgi:hypothetical protein
VALGPRELPFHGRVVPSEEREAKLPGGELPRHLPIRRSLEHLGSFIESTEINVAGCGIEIAE